MRMTMKLAVVAAVFVAGIASDQGLDDGADVWYKFNAAANTSYTLKVAPESGFAATMALFSGASVGNLATAVPSIHEVAGTKTLASLAAGEYYVRVAGLKQGAAYSEGAFNIELSAPVAPCVVAPVINAADASIACDDFAAAQDDVKAAFEGVSVGGELCTANAADVLKNVRVKQIAYTSLKKGATQEVLNLTEIAGKIKDFGEYDNSIAKTQKMFHYYLIFKPGDYVITYEMSDPAAATAEQVISVAKNCGGCMGCLGCDSCAGCRDSRIPDYADQLKRVIGDWLLVGLSILVAMSWSAMRKTF